jgi:polyisoprenoid-binding protein YceI
MHAIMNRNIKIAVAVALVLLATAAGAYAYYLVGTPTKAPSQPVTPPPSNQGPTPPPQAIPEPSKNVPDAMAATGTERIYRIDATTSTATFTLEEDLRGVRTTVAGTTSNISGEFSLDRDNIKDVRIGTIRINARTFKTDSEQRNRAIVRMIFRSEDDMNEFIEFTPTKAMLNASNTANGELFPFSVTGDLKISGATRSATFEGKAQFISDAEIRGAVETMLRYADYGLSVPQLPFLANVDENVKLRLDFVAKQ